MKQTPGCMTLLPLLPAFLLPGEAPLQARLGESPARLEARFGAPVQVKNGLSGRDFLYTYKHDGIVIVVGFLDEKPV